VKTGVLSPLRLTLVLAVLLAARPVWSFWQKWMKGRKSAT